MIMLTYLGGFSYGTHGHSPQINLFMQLNLTRQRLDSCLLHLSLWMQCKYGTSEEEWIFIQIVVLISIIGWMGCFFRELRKILSFADLWICRAFSFWFEDFVHMLDSNSPESSCYYQRCSNILEKFWKTLMCRAGWQLGCLCMMCFVCFCHTFW
jgi:hypothetical protein